ncbi:MAG: hypothetical protein ACI8TF_002719 [Paracoccaceae bacterium]
MNRFGLTRMDLWLRLSISVGSLILITSAATQRGVMGVLGIEIIAIGVVFLCGTAVWKLFKRSHD